MERSRLLQCLAADYMRLRDVAGAGLTAPVPSCPGWTVTDLVRHVGQVYLHKAVVMRTGAWPDPWPPAETTTEHPIALLDRAYGALTHEFSRRGDTDAALTWHAPDQTAKFWIRRMAQETVIHRLDAELALHTDPAPIPDDLALDGIDEVLHLFVAYGSKTWHEDFAAALSSARGHTVLVQATDPSASPAASSTSPASAPSTAPSSTQSSSSAEASSAAASSGALGSSAAGSRASGSSAAGSAAGFSAAPGAPVRAWLLRAEPGGVTVASTTEASANSAAIPSSTGTPGSSDAVVTGSPAPLLRWLWARELTPTNDAHDPIQVKGDEEAIKELRTLLVAGTQ